MTTSPSRYADFSVRPEIIRDAPLLTIALEPGPGVAEAIPPALAQRQDGRLILNMWVLSDPLGTTGFGHPEPGGISYFAAEVGGEEGATSDGETHFPGRLWLTHWGNSPAARHYAKRVSGVEIAEGWTSLDVTAGILTAMLTLDGRTVISAHVSVGDKLQATLSGHSIYYAERTSASGGREVARFDVPWIADTFPAADATVDFSFSEGNRALKFVGNGRQTIKSVAFRRMTLVPYLASGTLLAS